MKTNKVLQALLGSILGTALACLLISAAGGQPTGQAGQSRKAARRAAAAEAGVDLPNFGRINDHYFRGAQPLPRQYDDLAAIGVKTIVDLRDDARPYAKEAAERAGLRYINLPLNDRQYPPEDAAERFLAIVNDQANWPVYVHCAGGRHRTGAMTAVYQMAVDGWDVNRAYAEMKQYDFYTRSGHKPYRTYVFDYYRDLQARGGAAKNKVTGE
jgi:protein tyrosine/serine phosphatase